MGYHKLRGELPARLQLAAELVTPHCPSELLEIGCGTGVLIRHLATRHEGLAASGIDRSAKMIQAARGRLNDLLITGRLTLRTYSLEQKPFAAFPLIVAVDVNAFWTAPVESFGHLDRWLKPGGCAVLVFSAPGKAKVAEISRRIGSADWIPGRKIDAGVTSCGDADLAYAIVAGGNTQR